MPRRQFRKSIRPIANRLRPFLALTLLVAMVSSGLAAYYWGSEGGYVVQPGDSLWSIAVAHGTTVAELASINHLDPNRILLIGRHLQLPSVSTEPRLTAAQYPAGGGSGDIAATAFCAGFVASPGPYGVLPYTLASSPGRLALQPLFEKWAAYYGLDLPLLEAVDWQESGWQQSVVSYTGAVGVGQIMPATGVFIANVVIGEAMNVNSVSDNIRMSAAFLAYLSGVEHDNRCATIAAYYEGPVNLAASGLFPSTEQYVADVEALLPRFE